MNITKETLAEWLHAARNDELGDYDVEEVVERLATALSDAQKTIEQLREENKELLKVHAICETLTRELQAARNQLKDANEHIEKHHAEERRRRSSFNL